MGADAAQFRLEGQVVAVVGASRGIGAATAIACARAGADSVALIGRSADRLRRVAEQVRAGGAASREIVCDVTDEDALREALDGIPSLDVLVEAAGANQPEPFVAVSGWTFDRLVGLNLRAAFFAAQTAARKMIAAGGGGVIVFISSQMGHVGAADRSVYCATKHAIEGLTKALGVELAGHGIRVVSVAPTFIRTEMTASQLDDPQIGPALLAQIPAGRFGATEEVAAAVLYAASPAAALLTGTSLVLDGGWTAR